MDDKQLRLEALNQAVIARQETDTPETLVARAEAFYVFLAASQKAPAMAL